MANYVCMYVTLKIDEYGNELLLYKENYLNSKTVSECKDYEYEMFSIILKHQNKNVSFAFATG